MYVRELCVQYRWRRLEGNLLPTSRLLSPADASQVFTRLLGDEAVEVCGVLCLATTYQVLAYHELSRGFVDGTIVHPREVFKVALLANARSLILGHNHPSGDPSPSAPDLDVTRRIVSAGKMIGVDVLDHLIVAGESFVSLREWGQSGGLEGRER